MKKIAIVKDRTNFWPHYQREFEKYGYSVKLFDIWSKKEQDKLLSESIDAFVWRAKHNPRIKNLAKRLIYLFNIEFNTPTYPDWHSYWHYDDKIAQAYLFKKFNIPTPATYIFFKKEEALRFLEKADYPIIAKSPYGAGSSNVQIFRDKTKSQNYVKKAFKGGLPTFFKNEVQKQFVYFQKFMIGNSGDFKIFCYGNHTIHGAFRKNRDKKPLASGGGNWHIRDLTTELLNMISKANETMNHGVMTYDVLQNESKQWVITEMSYMSGDLTPIYNIYDETPIYHKKDDKWVKEKMKDKRIERLIKYLIEEQWKWL